MALGGMLLLTIFVLLYVYQKVLKPFHAMSSLSYELAKGNLSTPIKEEYSCSPSDFAFHSTAELPPLREIIGQERAIKAFEFGLAVKMKGYNIYMSGPSGTGKTTYALSSTEKLAETEPVPMNWCYVYNFQNQMKPMAISIDAGVGKQFKEDMAELVAEIRKEIILTNLWRSSLKKRFYPL